MSKTPTDDGGRHRPADDLRRHEAEVWRRRAVVRRHRLVALAVTALVVALVWGVVSLLPRSDTPVGDAAATTTAPGTANPPAGTGAIPADGQAVDAAYYADGSCRLYPPTAGDRGRTVFLDAGHGGPDQGGEGATSGGKPVTERSVTLPVVARTATLLRSAGFRVVLSRTTSGSVVRLAASDLTSDGRYTNVGVRRDLTARSRCANDAHADVLVSVHFNVGGRSSYGGALTTYDDVRPFSPQNLRLARLLQKALIKDLGVQDRGVVTDDTVGNSTTDKGASYGRLLVLGPTKAGFQDTPSMMPGALVEPLFLSNPSQADLAVGADGQNLMARAITTAVTSFLTTGG